LRLFPPLCLTAFLILLFLFPGCAHKPSASVENGPPPATVPGLPEVMSAALADTYTYDKLGELSDVVGHRLAASRGMQRAIEWSLSSMREAGFDSVWTEPVTVPHWTRGKEWARCIAPADFQLDISGLGLSDGTAGQVLEAEVLAVKDFDELDARREEVPGKIVLFNPDWEGYGPTVQYRVHGASRAARHGAVAVLVRSVTGVSLGAPHTGMMMYAKEDPRIPAAAVTVEDAGRLFRLCRRGFTPVVQLSMEAENHGETTCYNVIGDIHGSEHPEEIVLLGGHLDSWDVGTCAMDDGAGCALALGVGRLFLQHGLRPRRTVRVVHFTSEEFGGHGGRAYKEAHLAELDRHILALESDSGSYTPRGFSIDADSTVIAQLDRWLQPLQALSPELWRIHMGGSGVDVGPIVRAGVPGAGHRVDGSAYFDIHHSQADTFEKVEPEILARNLAAMAGLVWAVADNEVSLRDLIQDGGNR
jgi:carboxypeptidase Q